MFNFRSAETVTFLPDADAQAFVQAGLRHHYATLGAATAKPGILRADESLRHATKSLDGLFELLCDLQAQVGQSDVEFTLVELEEAGPPPVSMGFAPLGDPTGQMLHTFHCAGDYALVVMPALFRVPDLLLASAAREIGRIAIHQIGGHDPKLLESDYEADAELAAVALGLGVFVANGAYMFENSCCGGGCGVDLKSVRAGLSMPEACYALALDAGRRGLSRREAAKALHPTQHAALKESWRALKKAGPVERLLAAPPTHAALPASTTQGS